MRKELYRELCKRLKTIGGGTIKHVDLWNHNVEFIEQEEQWERPAVFIEFEPIHWKEIVMGVEYRGEAVVNLHVVTDWEGSSADGSELQDESLEVFNLLDEIHRTLVGMSGKTFKDFDIVESATNHNHEDIIENIEIYSCVAIKKL